MVGGRRWADRAKGRRNGGKAASRRAVSIYGFDDVCEHMGYHVLDPRGIEQTEGRSADRRSISGAASLDNLGCHLFEAEPGEQVPLVYHYHEEQEELFYVLEGTLSVETPERTYTVDTGEVFVAEPEHPHRAFNDPDASDTVRLLAIGAPNVRDGHEYEPESGPERSGPGPES